MSMLTIENLIKNKETVYVKNNTHTLKNKSSGTILLVVTGIDGKRISIPIPNTYLPVNLNLWVSNEVLYESSDLRAFIRKGILTLCDPDEAEAELTDPNNKIELRRLKELYKTESSRNSKLLEDLSMHIGENDVYDEDEEMNNNFSQIEEDITEDDIPDINPKVLSLVALANSGENAIHDILSKLNGMRNVLLSNKDNCHYIINEVKDGQIKSFAEELLVSEKNKTKKKSKANTKSKKKINIKKIRDKYDLSQKDLADKMNISTTKLSKMERGKDEITQKHIKQISNIIKEIKK